MSKDVLAKRNRKEYNMRKDCYLAREEAFYADRVFFKSI